MRTLNLGIVPYLNVLPLLEGLDRAFPPENWVRATPRELAGLLAAGEVDVATLPTFEGLRAGGRYTLVPGAAIACDGPVRSVTLFSKVPLKNVHSVLLDRSSLTSAHLVRILAAELLDIAPAYTLSQAPITAAFDCQAAPEDAFLVIGDLALQWEHAFPHKLDLGGGWRRLTGLPFVFAAWWTRAGLSLSEEEAQAFSDARALGEKSTAEIAARLDAETTARHGGAASLAQYLAEAVRYRLGERELEAVDLFRRKLAEHELLAQSVAP